MYDWLRHRFVIDSPQAAVFTGGQQQESQARDATMLMLIAAVHCAGSMLVLAPSGQTTAALLISTVGRVGGPLLVLWLPHGADAGAGGAREVAPGPHEPSRRPIQTAS